MVDANGACDAAGALRLRGGVRRARRAWFEEPVSSDDVDGLRLVRERTPAGMAVAAGEYANDAPRLPGLLGRGRRAAGRRHPLRRHHRLPAGRRAVRGPGHAAVGALRAGAGGPPVAAAQQVRHIEWFHDHVRIESMLFHGAVSPEGGELRPDPDAAGHGLSLDRGAAERYRV